MESSWQTNFNTGFSSTRSDVLVHLAQWQYWWWFWFAFLWSFYFLVVNKTVRARALKMRPKYVTSYRPHGKWGDFLVCVIPVSWCLNILINSNFILRLIEWQSESSLFTIRVRARQWYWVYKFELKNFTDILATPKNVGFNHWQINVFGDLQTSDDYLHILQLRSQNDWIKNYWQESLKKYSKTNKAYNFAYQEDTTNFVNNFTLPNQHFTDLTVFSEQYNSHNTCLLLNKIKLLPLASSLFQITESLEGLEPIHKLATLVVDRANLNNIQNSFFLTNLDFYYSFERFLLKLDQLKFSSANFFLHNTDQVEGALEVKRSLGSKSPVRLLNNLFDLTSFTDKNTSDFFFDVRFNDNVCNIQPKSSIGTTYLTLKQKRYKRRKIIPSRVQYKINDLGDKTKIIKRSWKPLLVNNNFFLNITDENQTNLTRQYRMLKKNKQRSELFSINTCRRMIRTKRTLVIPAHVNLTLIANSYDVVHAWWIPGLGIKIDCVPGRSTHHTFFVDNVGFYYGQCAEICGRYHHHMPIRLCSLPFEHFLVWWHSFGLPKLLFTKAKRRFDVIYGFRQYVW